MKKLATLTLCLLLAASLLCAALAVTYTPGTYTGVGTGNNGEVKVDVEFSEDAIVSVTVAEHGETPGIGDAAVDQLPAKILEAQSLEVDVITGASNTSHAILEAVADAATQAGADPAELGWVVEEAEPAAQ